MSELNKIDITQEMPDEGFMDGISQKIASLRDSGLSAVQSADSAIMGGIDALSGISGAQAANFAGGFAPAAGIADFRGEYPEMPSSDASMMEMLAGDRVASAAENFEQGNYLTAGLQSLGAAGDALYAIPLAGPALGATLGTAMKAPRRVQKALQVATQSPFTKKEIQAIQKANMPEDVARLEFYGDSAPKEVAENLGNTIKTTGQYRGAPRDIDSKQKLGAMRSRLKKMLVDGADYKDWYADTKYWTDGLTGERAGLTDRLAAITAVTSQGAGVPANAGWAIKGYNQALAGDPIKTGRFPQTQSPNIQRIVEGRAKDLGPKRSPFYEALNQQSDRLRQTNDIRQARAFGYTMPDGSKWSQGLSPAQHRFMDAETKRLIDFANKNKLGGHDKWDLDEIQASIWVSQKAEQDGTSLAEAGKLFSDYTPTATVRTEAMPSHTSKHLKNIKANEEALREFSKAQDDIMQTSLGKNAVAERMNLLSEKPFTSAGLYEGVSNPMIGTPIAAGKNTASDLGLLDDIKAGIYTPDQMLLDPSSRKLIEAQAAAEGLARAQDTVGYTFLTPANKASDRNALKIDLGRPANATELKDLQRKMDEKYFTVGAEGATDPVMFVVPAKNGAEIILGSPQQILDVRKMSPDPAKNPNGWQKDYLSRVKLILGDKINSTEWANNSGDLIGTDFENWTYRPSQYIGKLETVPANVQQSINAAMEKIAPQLEKLDARMIELVPNVKLRNKYVRLVRKAFASGEGIAKIRQLVDSGALPAIVLAILAGGSLNMRDESDVL